MSTIKLGQETREVLRNFSSINNAMAFLAGNKIATMREDGSVAALADIPEALPVDFSIYEMNRFLGVLSLPIFADADLQFLDDRKVIIKSGQSSVNYFFAAKNLVRCIVGKKPGMPTMDLVFALDGDTMAGLMKAAQTLGHNTIRFVVSAGQLMVSATSPQNPNSNDYQFVVENCWAHPQLDTPDTENKIYHNEDVKVMAPDGTYDFKVENMNLLPGGYEIRVSSGITSKFTHTSRPIAYYIGQEKA